MVLKAARGLVLIVAAWALVVASASPSWADATLFLGSTTTPANRATTGFAIGGGLLFLGFEFEYASAREDLPAAAPALRTGTGSVLLQTPLPIAGLQPYFTSGAGLYRERLANDSSTNLALANGGGVKVSLAGPLRARFDYRVLRLNGRPQRSVVHRFYAGLNLSF
jgi:hypothetical protein